MIFCEKCKNEILQEHILYCPYCGQPIDDDGGVHSSWHKYDFSGNRKQEYPAFQIRNPEIFKLNHKIDDALLFGRYLIARSKAKIFLNNLTQGSDLDVEPVFETNCDSHKYCLLKPFLLAINQKELSMTRLDALQESDSIQLDQEPYSLLDLQKTLLLPYEFNKEGRHHSALLLICNQILIALVFTRNFRSHEICSCDLLFESDINHVQIGLDHCLYIYSRDCHVAQVSLHDLFDIESPSLPARAELREYIFKDRFELSWGTHMLNRDVKLYKDVETNSAVLVIDNRFGEPIQVLEGRNQRPIFDVVNSCIYFMGQDSKISSYNVLEDQYQCFGPDFQDTIHYDASRLRLNFDGFHLYGHDLYVILPLFPQGNKGEQRYELCKVILKSYTYALEPLQEFNPGSFEINNNYWNLPLLYSNGRIHCYRENKVIVSRMN